MHLGHNKVVASKIKEILYASIVKEKKHRWMTNV